MRPSNAFSFIPHLNWDEIAEEYEINV